MARALSLGALLLAGFGSALTPYARAQTTGTLAQLAGPAGCIGDDAVATVFGGPSLAGQGCAQGRAVGGWQAAISPDGRNLYTAGPGADVLAIFARDPLSGQLSQLPEHHGCIGATPRFGCAIARGFARLSSVAVSSDGRTVYATSEHNRGAVLIFRRDEASGGLTQLSGAQGCVTAIASNDCGLARSLEGATELALSPDGRSLYVASTTEASEEGDLSGEWGVLAAFRRDPTSGAITHVRGRGGCLVDSDEVSGPRDCGRGRALGNARDVTVSPDGRTVYVASFEGVAVLARNPRTGAVKQLRGTRGCHYHLVPPRVTAWGCALGRGLIGAEGVAVSADGRNVYVASGGTSLRGRVSHAVAAFVRNPRSGALRQLRGARGCLSEVTGRRLGGVRERCGKGRGLKGARDVVISPDGKHAYVAAGAGRGAVGVFARRRGSGALRQFRGRRGCLTPGGAGGCGAGRAIAGADDLVVSADGRHLYVLSIGAVAVFRRS